MKIDPNEQAFPEQYPEDGWTVSRGLTIRAYFAAMAMQGMLTRHYWDRIRPNGARQNDVPFDAAEASANARRQACKCAALYADELIAALNAEPKS